MDILISDNWLRDFLKTKATPAKIAEKLSLCGPSVEKIEKYQNDSVYSIEVTTNRIDSASTFGIAREAAAICTINKIPARLIPVRAANLNFAPKVSYLTAKVDTTLCPRFSTVLIRNVKIAPSPKNFQERLKAVGVRPINNIVDISNYIMHELGQPVHTFDYDKIKGAKMILRASRKGEKVITLDGKTFNLPGGDIVIEDGAGRLIDLAGIMGGKNSAVDDSSQNILLFVQTYNPVAIRKTSMALAQRTEAAELFEKGLDPELVSLGISRGISLFQKLTGGTPEKEILDIYPRPYRPGKISLSLDFISQKLGVAVPKGEIRQILLSLGFEAIWQGNKLDVSVPSFRASDVQIPEDIVEEIARIYGYHNLPDLLPGGALAEKFENSPFIFEDKIKNLLSGWGGIEIYTSSLVSDNETDPGSLRLKNPLGRESEYLRTTMLPSLVRAVRENLGEAEPFHLFEIANVYLPRHADLPQEKMTLAGIFNNYDFCKAKGIIESLLLKLNIQAKFAPDEDQNFKPSQTMAILAENKKVGRFGVLEQDSYIYYEFCLADLAKEAKDNTAFLPLPKFPAQIEDITFSFPEKTYLGEVITRLETSDAFIKRVVLIDSYKDFFTFRVWYQDPDKTLTDKEVAKIRGKIITLAKQKFGGIQKN